MHCPQCGFANLETAVQCAQCGAWLNTRGAASDELTTALEAVRRLRRFIPPVVADPSRAHKDPLRGAQREAPVLFADPVRSPPPPAPLAPDSVSTPTNVRLGRVLTAIRRYDGMVDKFTGDGLMAVFGAPNAHENDPELAVRAALDMQKATGEFEPIARAQLGAPLQIRIGIHSGLAVACIIGTQEQAAYTVIGETVNLAARFQSIARPGYVLVSEQVHRQTHALFNFQPAGTIPIKGIDQPLAVYEAVGERAEPLPTRGIAGVSSIFLGPA